MIDIQNKSNFVFFTKILVEANMARSSLLVEIQVSAAVK